MELQGRRSLLPNAVKPREGTWHSLGVNKVVADTGPGAPNPYMPPPLPNTGQQPHIPQNFAPTGRKKALICACNYRCPVPVLEVELHVLCCNCIGRPSYTQLALFQTRYQAASSRS